MMMGEAVVAFREEVAADIKYYRKLTPRQNAKFTRKSLLFNYVVLP